MKPQPTASMTESTSRNKMHAMKNRLILLLFPISGMCHAQATEYIINGNFESGSTPTCWAQGDFASSWESRYRYENGNYLHSPDYYDNSVVFPFGNCTGGFGVADGFLKPTVGAKSGTRFMGLGTYELIQQQYSSDLVPDLHYTVSMEVILSDMYPSSWNGTGRVKVGLAKNKVKYKNETGDQCSENYVTYKDEPFQDIRIIGTFDLNMASNPTSEGWKRISASFRAWENIAAYDWFFIDVEIPGYTPGSDPYSCAGDYIFVDDVSMKRAQFCFSPCSPDLGPITHGVLPDAMLANGFNPQLGYGPFDLLIENAIGIDFRVYGDWQSNAPIWEQHAFDPNGLKDVGFPDYQLYWIGEDANGNVFQQSGSYWYYLKMWNCLPGNMIVYEQRSLTYAVGTGNYVQPPDIVNYELNDCCDEYAFFQNTSFAGYYQKDVEDFITAGANVTGGSSGPVLVSAGANVLFHAGNVINLEPGFSVASGGVFAAAISNCIYGDLRSMAQSRRIIRELAPDEAHGFNSLEECITAWPNPSGAGRVQVLIHPQKGMEQESLVKLIISSMNGRVIKEVMAQQGQVVDLMFPESGVYMVRAVDSDQRTFDVEKVVIL